MAVELALAAILEGSVGHVLAAAEYARNSDDPEGIHQLRVGIRRLRAAMSIFGHAFPTNGRPTIGRKLQALQQRLGATRDLDVLIEETLASVPDGIRSDTGFGDLLEAVETKRATERRRARAALESRRCVDLLSQLWPSIDRHVRQGATPSASASQPIVGFAQDVLAARFRKARKLGERVRELDVTALHELRIRVKKLRYAAEFFRDLWPSQRAAHDLAALKDLQQALGAVQDLTVAAAILADVAGNAGPDAADAATRVGAAATQLAAREIGKLRPLWQSVAAHRRFWRDRRGSQSACSDPSARYLRICFSLGEPGVTLAG